MDFVLIDFLIPELSDDSSILLHAPINAASNSDALDDDPTQISQMAEESHDTESETASTFVTVSSQLTQGDLILAMSSQETDASVQGSRKQPISTSPMRRKKSPKNVSVSRRVIRVVWDPEFSGSGTLGRVRVLSSSDETDASSDEMMQRATKKGRANFEARQKKVNFENF